MTTKTLSAHEWLCELIARDDADLAAWAIDWLAIDLSEVWSDLDDDERDWLVDSGIVEEVEASVECTDAQSWQSDWREESNAAWPTYTLTITADGMDDIEVIGWHLVGVLGPDGNRRHAEWDTEDSDGAANGLPHVDEWDIRGGANVGGVIPIPCWRGESGWLTLDRASLGQDHYRGALSDAASHADHGHEPTWQDVDRDDMETHETRYIIRDSRIIEIEILTGGIAGHDVERYDGPDAGQYRYYTVTEYYATAWSTSETDDIYESEEEVVQSLCDLADNETSYTDEDDAKAALARLAYDAHDIPDGMDCDIDDAGLYVQPEDEDEDEDARYHLDAGQCSRVIRYGWSSVMGDIVDALGIRATLAGARQWQEEMDEIIDRCDPFVSVSDSLAGGNCRAETDRFRATLCDKLGGDVGAVRASVILAIRDDLYTRRACRVAAQRYMES